MILTVSRISEEKKANPGYRAFFSNGFNVTRVLVLFFWEILLELVGRAPRAARRDVRPRGHRGGIYPLLRATMCVVVRDLIVYGVLTDMMRGRPAIYATFSSYDEVAHHSGLERSDTLEALRKLDQQFARIDARSALRATPVRDRRPLRSRPDAGRDVQAAERLRPRRAGRALPGRRQTSRIAGGDEQHAMAGLAVAEATGTRPKGKPGKSNVGDRNAVVLGSGNLGLVYLMEEPRRLTLEEIERAASAAARCPARASSRGLDPRALARARRLALGRRRRALPRARAGSTETIPLAPFGPNAPHHLLRTDGFPHVADLMIGSFYDADLDEGCAFEELISFHGGLGGPQTRAVHPPPRVAGSARPTRSSAPSRCTRCSWAGGTHFRARRPRNRPHRRSYSRQPTEGGRVASKGFWAGWVAFAGLLLMIIGGLDFMQGLIALFRDQYYLVGDNGALVIDVSQWGWIMMIWGIALALIGYGLVAGSSWSRWAAIVGRQPQLPRRSRLRRTRWVHAVEPRRRCVEHPRPLGIDRALGRCERGSRALNKASPGWRHGVTRAPLSARPFRLGHGVVEPGRRRRGPAPVRGRVSRRLERSVVSAAMVFVAAGATCRPGSAGLVRLRDPATRAFGRSPRRR